MKKIAKYEADDGSVWDTVQECSFREWIVRQIEKVMAPLGDPPVGMSATRHKPCDVSTVHRGLRRIAYLAGIITVDRGAVELTETAHCSWWFRAECRPKFQPLIDAYERMRHIDEHGLESIWRSLQPNFVTSDHMDWQEKPTDPLHSTTA